MSAGEAGATVAQKTVECAVCGAEIDLPAGAKEGDIIHCPFCDVDLRLVKNGDSFSTEVF